jgi:L-asparagine oxygenase
VPLHTDVAPIREVDPDARAELTAAAEQLLTDYGSPRHPELLNATPGIAARLTDRLHAACTPCDSADGLFVLRGLVVDAAALEPTPAHWSVAEDAAALWDVTLLLLATLMGRPIAWNGQQDGRYVHNIVPTQGREEEQTGASSSVLLSPHTEDAFHPGRAHLLMLACMRNPDRIATTAASVRRIELSADDIAMLSTATVPILPDDSYTEAQASAQLPANVPVLWRSASGLTLRFDPAYTPLEEAEECYRSAYRRLEAQLERVTVAVSLRPGEVLVVDNDVVVHGRVPFRARFDGTDRWLKRASVRVPGRPTRPPAEAAEHGYGQIVLEAPC